MPDDEMIACQLAAYWLIARSEAGQMEVLIIDRDGEASFPIFGFEDEAKMFLRLGGFKRDGWRVSESTAGELVSMLASAPCKGTGCVVLDPFPEVVDRMLGTRMPAVTVSRQSFADCLHGNREILPP